MTLRMLTLIASLALLSGCATSNQVRVTTVESAPENQVASPSSSATTLRHRSANETEAGKIIFGVLAVTSLVILVLVSRHSSIP